MNIGDLQILVKMFYRKEFTYENKSNCSDVIMPYLCTVGL